MRHSVSYKLETAEAESNMTNICIKYFRQFGCDIFMFIAIACLQLYAVILKDIKLRLFNKRWVVLENQREERGLTFITQNR